MICSTKKKEVLILCQLYSTNLKKISNFMLHKQIETEPFFLYRNLWSFTANISLPSIN